MKNIFNVILGAALLLPIFSSAQTTDPEAKLKELGIQLITPVPPIANYLKAVRVGNMVYLSGHGPDKPGGGSVTGKVGKDITVEQAIDAARLTGISLLSTLKATIGDLNKVKRIVRVFGMVNAVDTFTQHPKVINGCSDLLVQVFGENGKHARTATGVAQLPFGTTLQLDIIFEI